MTDFEYRVLVLGLIQGIYTEKEALELIDADKCCICGNRELNENLKENDDGKYCETCWEAREEYGVMGDL